MEYTSTTMDLDANPLKRPAHLEQVDARDAKRTRLDNLHLQKVTDLHPELDAFPSDASATSYNDNEMEDSIPSTPNSESSSSSVMNAEGVIGVVATAPDATKTQEAHARYIEERLRRYAKYIRQGYPVSWFL